jgi:hypothetical protein
MRWRRIFFHNSCYGIGNDWMSTNRLPINKVVDLDLYPTMVLAAFSSCNLSAKNSQMWFKSQVKGSTDFVSHQHIHDLRLDDTVFEEFGSNVCKNRLIVFCKKPLFWYLLLKFCKQISSILDFTMDLLEHYNLE